MNKVAFGWAWKRRPQTPLSIVRESMGLRAPFQPQARAAALSRGNVGFSPAVASSPWLAQPWLRNHGCAGRGGLCPQAGPPTAACWPSLQPELASWPRVDSFAPSGPLPVTPGLVYPGDSLSGWVSTGGRGVPTPLSPEASSRAALPACLPACHSPWQPFLELLVKPQGVWLPFAGGSKVGHSARAHGPGWLG